MALFKAVLVLICFAYVIGVVSATPCVDVKDGRICGVEETVNETLMSLFLGVPYAKPITKDTRFLPPEPSQPFNGTFNASTLSPLCSQSSFNGSIQGQMDCLMLNIYVPTNRISIEGRDPLAAMVFIHGGGFVLGGASLYNGSLLAQNGNVIVVTINYRLGPFGFGYLLNSGWQGNVGLLDQRMALQWVKQNILAFGGDSELITIFGESAGAASVSAHLVAPASRALYKHAITESGSVLCQWGMKSNAYNNDITRIIAEFAGCSGKPSEIFSCVNQKSTDELLESYAMYTNTDETFIQWLSPIEEDADFFDGNALKQLEVANFEGRSIMTGTNGEEGGDFVAPLLPGLFEKYSSLTASEYYGYYGQFILTYFINLELPKPREAVLQFYSPPRSTNFFDGTLQLASDFLIRCCAGQESLRIVLPTAEFAYSYMFNHTTAYNEFFRKLGPYHGIELQFVFGNVFSNPQATESELELSKTIMRYWTNFAKFGKPTNNQSIWPPVAKDGKGIINTKVIDTERLAVKTNLKKEECTFWKFINDFIPDNRRNWYI